MSTFNKGDKVLVAADAKTSDGYEVYFGQVEVEATVIRRAYGDVYVLSKGKKQYVAPEYLTLIEEPEVQYRYFDSGFGEAYYRIEKVSGEDKYLVNVLHMHNRELSETFWSGDASIKVTEDASERKEWIEQCIKEGKVIPHISEFTVGQLWNNIKNSLHYEVIKVDDLGVFFTATKLNDPTYYPIHTYRESHDLASFEPADAQAREEWFKEAEVQEPLDEQEISKPAVSVQDSLADIVKALDVEISVATENEDASPTVSIRALREAYGYLEDVEYLDIDKLIELAKRLS